MRLPRRDLRARRPPTAEQRDALLDDLRRHRDEQAAAYRERARSLESPCLAGCHGCCHRLVLVELPDALLIARHLRASGAATKALRGALEGDAERAGRQTPNEYFGAAAGCVFLDQSSPGAACSIYDVRPADCRIWFIHGVRGDDLCGPGAPAREQPHLSIPGLEEADLRFCTRWAARFWSGVEARPVWVPLALGGLAALDLLEAGAPALDAWRPRLDGATQRSYALVDEIDE